MECLHNFSGPDHYKLATQTLSSTPSFVHKQGVPEKMTPFLNNFIRMGIWGHFFWDTLYSLFTDAVFMSLDSDQILVDLC